MELFACFQKETTQIRATTRPHQTRIARILINNRTDVFNAHTVFIWEVTAFVLRFQTNARLGTTAMGIVLHATRVINWVKEPAFWAIKVISKTQTVLDTIKHKPDVFSVQTGIISTRMASVLQSPHNVKLGVVHQDYALHATKAILLLTEFAVLLSKTIQFLKVVLHTILKQIFVKVVIRIIVWLRIICAWPNLKTAKPVSMEVDAQGAMLGSNSQMDSVFLAPTQIVSSSREIHAFNVGKIISFTMDPVFHILR